MKNYLLVALLALISAESKAQQLGTLRKDMYGIASDATEGRFTGSRGYLKAARYVEGELRSAGVRAWLQAVPFTWDDYSGSMVCAGGEAYTHGAQNFIVLEHGNAKPGKWIVLAPGDTVKGHPAGIIRLPDEAQKNDWETTVIRAYRFEYMNYVPDGHQSLKNDLLASGAVASVVESENPVTQVFNTNGGFTWRGKAPGLEELFTTMAVTTGFGKTVGWQVIAGRDFNPAFISDPSGFVVNEAAVKFMGLRAPLGETVMWNGLSYKIIGIVKNMVSQSVYDSPQPTLFFLPRKFTTLSCMTMKINPQTGAQEAIHKIGVIFKKYDTSTEFNYQFVSDDYAKKFSNKEHIGKLACCFAGLAILISCLGLFGMATFMAEQRIKEIGVRKVLGASVFSLWQLLSKDFIVLVAISLLIAVPAGYYFMHNWLQHYTYRTDIAWWIFAATTLGAMFITLGTVSFQSIKAALTNPVKSLRSE